MGGANFYLGFSVYKLGQATYNKAAMTQGLKYMQEAASGNSSFSGIAAQTAYSMKNEITRMP